MAKQQDPRFFTGTIAGWSVRSRRIVLGVWVLIIVLAVGACVGIGANTDLESTGVGDSSDANVLLEERFGTFESAPTEIVVFEHPSLTVEDPEYQQVVTDLMADLRELRADVTESDGGVTVQRNTRVVAGTTTHYDIVLPNGNTLPRDAPVLDEDGNVLVPKSPFVAQNDTGGDVTFASVELEGELDASAASSQPAAIDEVEQLLDVVAAAAAEAGETGFTIVIGGDASSSKQVDDITQEDLGFASLINTPLTFVILIIALGALGAAFLPIILAFLGVAVAGGLLALISQATPLESIYVQIVLLMGLAAGIDYCLFLFTRYRIERDAGYDQVESMERSSHAAGKGVFIAATTTVLALLGMFLVGDPVFTSLGIAAVVTILVAAVISVTLTPASYGDWMDRVRMPLVGYRKDAPESPVNLLAGRLVRIVVKQPLICGGIVLIALIAISYPMFTLNLGFNGAKALHDDVESKAAFLALEENFSLGLTAPAQVVVDAGKNQNIFQEDYQAAIQGFIQSVRARNVQAAEAGEDPIYGEPIQTVINDAGDTEIVEIPLNADIGEARALDAVEELRDDLIPAAFGGTNVEQALVTGASAGNLDFQDNIAARTPLVLGFVLLTAYLVLVIMYRSLVIPFIAVVLNLFAVGGAYGILTLVFQEGYALESILNFEATGIVESWLPLFVFCIMFGISMDYLTFGIGRVKEFHDAGVPTNEAIIKGIGDGFGTVFSAAAIMIAVATVFAFLRNIAIQQFGFTLAVAVLLDATVIVGVLLPAALKIAGESLWFFPAFGEGKESTGAPAGGD